MLKIQQTIALLGVANLAIGHHFDATVALIIGSFSVSFALINLIILTFKNKD